MKSGIVLVAVFGLMTVGMVHAGKAADARLTWSELNGGAMVRAADSGVGNSDGGGNNAPTGVTASRGDYLDKVRISWDAFTGADYYEVWCGGAGNSEATEPLGTVSTTYYDDMTASRSRDNTYKVRAFASDGTMSEFSDTVTGYLAGPAIRANGVGGEVRVPSSEPVAVSVRMHAGVLRGNAADWWVVAVINNAHYYNLMMDNFPESWIQRDSLDMCLPIMQAPVEDVSEIEVLRPTHLPRGTHSFYFGVDDPDGVLNLEPFTVIYDVVTVIVE